MATHYKISGMQRLIFIHIQLLKHYSHNHPALFVDVRLSSHFCKIVAICFAVFTSRLRHGHQVGNKGGGGVGTFGFPQTTSTTDLVWKLVYTIILTHNPSKFHNKTATVSI